MTESLPSFDSLANLLAPLGALGSPAELHGMLCGRLCGGGRYEAREWLDAAWECLGLEERPAAPVEAKVAELYRLTLSQLHDESMNLEMLLPDDDTEMEQRLTALSHWCNGFLGGFGSAGVGGDTRLSSETADALRDFAAFVQISTETEEDEDSETDFMEIVEYVRIASLTMFMELGLRAEAAGTPAAPEILH